MKEAKPICLIKVDMDADFGNGRKVSIGELMEIFQDKMPDYYVFVIPQGGDPTVPREIFEFQVFYDKDFTEIDYASLKILIQESLN